ncbi:SDR family NAD(P)-dependent oxidoreductase [Actinospongicola halichondriae]|uniref:SDR family NAD(P)-dependent oxidoreductase n=1 Tax=Actinospongicola halichondriae TaxID=3236844 RepID=UPI003D4B17F4
MTDTSRRIAIVANASFFIGPAVARGLAERGHDLVIGDPEDGLVADLEAAGAAVEVVTGVRDLAEPESAGALVATALTRFGRIDAATAFSGQVVTGRFTTSSIDDLRAVTRGCLEAPYRFLRAVVPVMVEQGSGQVLLFTSASGARPTPGAPLYSSVRAGANHLVRNVADEVARNGVQVNAIGTNFMDFPEFRRASGADDPEVRAQIEQQTPMRRLGTVEECAALGLGFLDGTCEFVTGQFIAHDGGWAI